MTKTPFLQRGLCSHLAKSSSMLQPHICESGVTLFCQLRCCCGSLCLHQQQLPRVLFLCNTRFFLRTLQLCSTISHSLRMFRGKLELTGRKRFRSLLVFKLVTRQ